MKIKIQCGTCNGTGKYRHGAGFKEVVCLDCNGKGELWMDYRDILKAQKQLEEQERNEVHY